MCVYLGMKTEREKEENGVYVGMWDLDVWVCVLWCMGLCAYGSMCAHFFLVKIDCVRVLTCKKCMYTFFSKNGLGACFET